MATTIKGKNWVYTKERGFSAGMTGDYLVTIPKTEIADGDLAVAYAVTEAGVPKYGDMFSGYVPLYCMGQQARLGELTSDVWLVTIICDFVPAHKLGNNYVLTMRASCSSQTVSHAWDGSLLQVSYTDPITSQTSYQAGEIQILYPGAELVAVGVSTSADPAGLIGDWMGFCNSVAWQGYPEYSVLCMGGTYEPISLATSPHTYRFEFQFQVQPPLPGTSLLGWQQYLLWRDGNGRVPVDAAIFNGIAIVSPYPAFDFNTAYPLGVPA